MTNPPLDSYREKMVTSMFTQLGAQADVLNPGPDAAHRIHLDSPILGNQTLANLASAAENAEASGSGADLSAFKAVRIPGLYSVAHGGKGLREAIKRVRRQVTEAIEDGATILILSDRESDERYAPIPSLLLTSAVHHHMVQEKTRTRASLVVEAGGAREVHHLAMLINFGADAINPYMALETVHEMANDGRVGVAPEKAEENYISAATTGIQKVMSKMGICLLYTSDAADE